MKCSTCKKQNQIVNQCGCDPNNLPTPTDRYLVYSLRKIQTFTGREGYGLNADIYRLDKKIGEVHDRADGGQPDIDIREAGERQLFVQFVTQWFETTGLPMLAASFPDMLKIEHSAHSKMETWINDYVDTLKTKKQLDRLSKKNTLFRVKGDKPGEWRSVNIPYGPRAQAFLDQNYAGKEIEIYGNPSRATFGLT